MFTFRILLMVSHTLESFLVVWVGLEAHGANLLDVPLLGSPEVLREYPVDGCVGVELRLEQLPNLHAHVRAYIEVDVITPI